ncbi:hypothetical protein [Helcococcus bovis]|uniref:hypothetical protein n=1 Tax=Helcococcus bovis TaxID=3153252 RepID=UPI0038BD035A
MNITVKVLVANYINEQILSYMEKIYYCKINFEIGIFDEVNNEYIKKITEGSIKELEYTNEFGEIVKEKILFVLGYDILYNDLNLENGTELYQQFIHFNFDIVLNPNEILEKYYDY